MAFITVANSKRILRKLDLKELELKDKVYDRPIYIFNRWEERSLLAYKELLMNPEKFVKEVYQKVKRGDSYTYVYEGEIPCYHKMEVCERLNAEFCNFRIPEEIRKRGRKAVQSFRDWFKSNRHLLDGKDDIFEMRINAAFGIKLSIEEVRLRNSGVIAQNNYTLEELESKINMMLKQAGGYYYQSPKNTAILKRYGKIAYIGNSLEPLPDRIVGYSETEVKTFLKDYEERFKRPIKDMLYDYYRVKFNPSLSMEGKLLDQLGFRPCRFCFS